MRIGYARVSKADGSQTFDLQRDALIKAGVARRRIYCDHASGKRDDRPNLTACLKALRRGDVLVIWKLDRLGRDLRHLVNTVQALSDRGIGLKVLVGQGAEVDTTTAGGKFVFGIFAALAEFERELIRERTRAGLEAARARGRKGGRRFSPTPALYPGRCASGDGQAGNESRRVVLGARHQPRDALPLCGPQRRAAGVWPSRARLLKRSSASIRLAELHVPLLGFTQPQLGIAFQGVGRDPPGDGFLTGWRSHPPWPAARRWETRA